MLDIIDLEIRNLSPEEKEKLFNQLSYREYPRTIQLNEKHKSFEDWYKYRISLSEEEETADIYELSAKEKADLLEDYNKWVDYSENAKYKFQGYFNKTQYYQNLDQALTYYFKEYDDEFIYFQKHHKNSLYNQIIKKHNFEDLYLDYEDVLKYLPGKAKEKIFITILSHIRDDQKFFEKWEKMDKAEQKKQLKENYFYSHMTKDLENYKNSKFFFVKPEEITEKFDNPEDEYILFALKNPVLAPAILWEFGKVLNPHYSVNNWILREHEFAEKEKKYSLEQGEKFEVSNVKMKILK
ncbi:hypothetical protein [Mesomycoplasma hyopneumoniae]|uniref:hypothetical protein n=1 Tax=Mesomycoplasma hyopneumoniae TaxID=2099 RepID=UPI003DA63FA9